MNQNTRKRLIKSMAELGYFALIIAFCAASYALLIDLLAAWRKDNALIASGRNATIVSWFCLTVSMFSLWALMLQCDFSVTYVAEHISRSLPFAYKLSALWAGAAGSLLLWLWMQVGFAVIVFSKIEEPQKLFTTKARAAVNLVTVFFIMVLLFDKNPFALSVPVLADGAGLNPLLQHPAMVLHPPTLFIGYAAFVIPFAWSFAELKEIKESGPPPLFIQARNWTLIAWLFLTIGIVLGAWWAYEELGWGGYWAWDPVENSSLMPWLTATALLHCFRTYRPRTMVARWVTMLSLITFSLCVFGTFLTRYGLVSSVHAFPEPGLGILFMVLIVHIWIIAAVLLWRKCSREPINSEVTALPGIGFINVNSWLLIILTFVIFVGTLFPFFSGLLSSRKINLEPEYFTKITSPFGLALLLLLGLCPYFLRNNMKKNWRIVGAVIVIIASVLVWFFTKSMAIPCFIFCGFAAIGIISDFFGSTKTNEGQLALPRKNLRWYGARVVHISVVMMYVGIAASGAFSIEKQVVLKSGESVTVKNLNFKYEGLNAKHGSTFTAVGADIVVTKNSKGIGKLDPAIAYYRNKQTSEVDIKRSLAGDIYLALTAVDNKTKLINLRVLIKPLVNWIWIGSFGLVIGTSMVLVSFYKRKKIKQ